MSFFDPVFVLFLLIVIALMRCTYGNKVVLLAANILFLSSFGGGTILWAITLSVLIWLMAKFLDKTERESLRKLMFGVGVCIVPIFIMGVRLQTVFSGFVIIGLSFYGLQLEGYYVDVYKKRISSENSILDYLLWITFFAYFTSGPITKYEDIRWQLDHLKPSLASVKNGMLKVVYGSMMKLIVGERLAIIVNTVYGDYIKFSGLEILICFFSYSFQLYCDFGGYSLIAEGLAEIFGVRINSNFMQPYLSRTVSEFWRRWHISLSTWLRDYIYIPLGGNRYGTPQKYINILIVFLVSGIWHGNGIQFLVWGGLHGAYQIIGGLTRDKRENILRKVGLDLEAFSYKLWQTIITFISVTFAWVFFRAPSVTVATKMIKRLVRGFDLGLSFGHRQAFVSGRHFSIGKSLVMDMGNLFEMCDFSLQNTVVLFIGLTVVLCVDMYHYYGGSVRKFIYKQNTPFRWLIYMLSISILLIWGIYGGNWNATGFIYSNF